MTAPRFSRFTTTSSPPTSGAHRSALARLRKLKNKYSSLPQISLSYGVVSCAGAARPPPTRRRSASNHARRRDVGGAGPRSQARQGPPRNDAGSASRPPRPREHGLRLAVDQRLSQKRQYLKGPQGNHPRRAAGQRRPVACFSPPSARSSRPHRDSQRYPRARCRSFFINRSHPYRRRFQRSHS